MSVVAFVNMYRILMILVDDALFLHKQRRDDFLET